MASSYRPANTKRAMSRERASARWATISCGAEKPSTPESESHGPSRGDCDAASSVRSVRAVDLIIGRGCPVLDEPDLPGDRDGAPDEDAPAVARELCQV